MPKIARELSAIEIARLSDPGVYFVGCIQGLALRVSETRVKYWFLRCTIAGKRRDVGIGGYPNITLGDSRKMARILREKIRAGIDPIEERRATSNALAIKLATAWTFDECSKAYIESHQLGWKNAKHVDQWRSSLKKYASPFIGKAREIQQYDFVSSPKKLTSR